MGGRVQTRAVAGGRGRRIEEGPRRPSAELLPFALRRVRGARDADAMALGLLELCNWSTLAVCTALKLPQISALLAARSARGLSLPSLLLELAG